MNLCDTGRDNGDTENTRATREFISLRVHQNAKSYVSKDTIRNVREHRVRRDCLDTQGTEPVQSNRGPEFSVEEGLDTHFSSEDIEMVKRRRCWMSLDPRPILKVYLAAGRSSQQWRLRRWRSQSSYLARTWNVITALGRSLALSQKVKPWTHNQHISPRNKLEWNEIRDHTTTCIQELYRKWQWNITQSSNGRNADVCHWHEWTLKML